MYRQLIIFLFKIFKINERLKKISDKIIKEQNFVPIIETKDEDVFIAGFPKSGNTWMQNLITGLILDCNSERITPQLVSEFVPDEHAKKYYKRIYPIMVFKTHNLPNKRYKKVIHLIRDGRDAMISYHKMEINRNKNYKYSLKEMIVEGKGVFPVKWHIHTRMWTENPFNSDIITIKYEDLLMEPLPSLQKICDFLKIEMNDKRMMEIYDANNIIKLRNKVSNYGWDYDYVYTNKKSDSFFRKGTSGNYKEELDSLLLEYFVQESKDELELYGYKL